MRQFHTPLTVMLVTALLAGPLHAVPDITQLTSVNLHSLELRLHVVTENRDELNKISSDFAAAYRLHSLMFTYEAPGKLRYESNVIGIGISYTINGNKKYTSVPAMHMHQVEDVTGSPYKKQTLIDVGLISPELLNDFTAEYIGMEGKTFEFALRARVPSEGIKDVVWINPATRITERRYHYGRNGKLQEWFIYSKPIAAAPGVFLPSRVEVYNQENKLGAVSSYSDIKVNLPVEESLFDF